MKTILLGFVVGVMSLVYQQQMWHIATGLWVGLGVFSLVLCGMLYHAQVAHVLSQSPVKWGCYHALLLSCAAVFGCGYAQGQLNSALHARLMQPMTVEKIVRISGISDGVGARWRQMVEVVPSELEENSHQATRKWLLYAPYAWDKNKPITPPAMLPNQYWRVTVKLKPVHSNASFAAFAVEKWLLAQHVSAVGTVQHAQLLLPAQVAALGLPQGGLRVRWDTWVQQQRLAVRQHFQQFDSPARGVLLGLLTGDRSLIDPETTQLYQHMGISHLLAISGPHVVLAAWVVVWCCRYLLNFFPGVFGLAERRRWLLPMFVLVVLLYACLAGFDVPAQRTVWMVLVMTGLLWWRQVGSAVLALLLAASVMLLLDPLAILSAAFWLSFGAVAILLSMSHAANEDLGVLTWWQRAMHTVKQFVLLQWRLFVLLTPLVLLVFAKVSLLSPVVNLIAIPLLTLLVVPLNLLAWLLWRVAPSCADIIWQVLLWVLQGFHTALQCLAQVFPNALLPFHLSPIALIALSVALFILLLPKGVVPKWWAAFLLLPALYPYQYTAPLRVHVLDVGQGLSVIIQTKHHAMLVDAGAKLPSQREGMGEKVVLPALQTLGIRLLDKMLLTHLDNDHSGGAPAILQQMPVIQLSSNAPFEQYPTHLCEAGQQWQWDGVRFRILAPWSDEAMPLSANDASCVLMIELLDTQSMGHPVAKRVLIMGDAGFYTEFKLQQRKEDIQADILVLGHHGSRHSSSSPFLQAVSPQRAVVSAGFLNRYGHPATVVLQRLQEQDITVDATVDSGALSYYLGTKDGLVVKRYRDRHVWLQRHITGDTP